MSFDNSRFPFDPWKNFSGVVMEQGRVQLDADWNEWLAELSRRIQAETLDIFGHAAYPATTPSAFLITATSGTPNTVTIGLGRMYVDGLLAENHGERKTASWDPALAELSGTPQPPDPTNPNPNPIDFTDQPYYPGATPPQDNGSYLFYLDVWIRDITFLEDPHLIDIAVGVDTTGRLQTVWQVKYMSNTGGGWTCATPDSKIWPTPTPGLLTTDVVPNPTAGPCCLTDGSGFTGVENQFYRVEIHQAGQGTATANTNSGTATFKFSRDNASVETGVTAITPGTNTAKGAASVLTVMSLGRDQVLGFHAGDWIEILDSPTELWGFAGDLFQIDSVDVGSKTITLTTTVATFPLPATGIAPPTSPASFPVDNNNLTDPRRHTRIRRWDQSGTVYDVKGNTWCDLSLTGGAIPVSAPGTTLVLENGITVTFDTDSAGNPLGGNFNVADYWTFAARTADGSVEKLVDAPPLGIHHHYTKLSTVTFSSPASNPDCRTPWPSSPAADCGCCCTATVGDNVNSFGKYTSIQQAINSLPTTGPNIGGEVCILPGRYFEYFSVVGLSDVVIHGCGAETRLASPTMKPGGGGSTTSDANPGSGFAAIITIMDSTNVELSSFAVEAADNEVGILLDGTLTQGFVGNFPSDVTISDLALTASTLPALAVMGVDVLNCTNNRIAMNDVASQWPAVYLTGTEMHFEKNWVGLEDASNAKEWMPFNVVTDLGTNFNTSLKPPLANGGIQIAGSSTDVFVIENEIEGGAFNGITLGSFEVVRKGQTGGSTPGGVLPSPPDPCSTTSTLNLPSTVNIGQGQVTLVAGGPLLNILIARNRIRNMGLCGIGPVGFFNLKQTIEVISIENLTITGNTISGSLQNTLSAFEAGVGFFSFGYGAVCVPDVQNLILRDNTITDFGPTPGAQVCGIYVLNGEQVEISRNQVLETRDWSGVPNQSGASSGGAQAGIEVALVTPPPLDQIATASAWKSSFAEGSRLTRPLYQPGLPALRVENNVVRVPLGPALEVIGYGPFSIVDNHFSSGGTVPSSSGTFIAAGETEFNNLNEQVFSQLLTVVIINLGLAIEFDTLANSFYEFYNNATPLPFEVGSNPLAASSSGAVLFTNNICQLETRASGVQGFTSVIILSLDQVTFANNHCWVDGPPTAFMDALLLAATLNVTSNRFQETLDSVFISGFTFGLSNVTANNISTHCLLAVGVPAWTIKTPNVVFNTIKCPE